MYMRQLQTVTIPVKDAQLGAWTAVSAVLHWFIFTGGGQYKVMQNVAIVLTLNEAYERVIFSFALSSC